MVFNAVLVIVLFLLPVSSTVPEGAVPVPTPLASERVVLSTSTPHAAGTSTDGAVRPAPELVDHRDSGSGSVEQGAREYLVPVVRAGTVRDAMREQERTGTVRYEGRDYPGLGYFLESINGVRAEKGAYWFLYINGELSDRGASSADVAPGDTVYWRLEENIYY